MARGQNRAPPAGGPPERLVQLSPPGADFKATRAAGGSRPSRRPLRGTMASMEHRNSLTGSISIMGIARNTGKSTLEVDRFMGGRPGGQLLRR